MEDLEIIVKMGFSGNAQRIGPVIYGISILEGTFRI